MSVIRREEVADIGRKLIVRDKDQFLVYLHLFDWKNAKRYDGYLGGEMTIVPLETFEALWRRRGTAVSLVTLEEARTPAQLP